MIELKDIRQALLLSQARIQALEYTTTSEPLIVVKILTEIRQFDMAIELGLAYNQGAAYALAGMIAGYALNVEFNRLDAPQKARSIFNWHQEQLHRVINV